MEAKDTVMSTEDIKRIWEGRPNDISSPTTFDEWLCLAQAEVSFRAGYDEGYMVGYAKAKEPIDYDPFASH